MASSSLCCSGAGFTHNTNATTKPKKKKREQPSQHNVHNKQGVKRKKRKRKRKRKRKERKERKKNKWIKRRWNEISSPSNWNRGRMSIKKKKKRKKEKIKFAGELETRDESCRVHANFWVRIPSAISVGRERRLKKNKKKMDFGFTLLSQ